MRAVGPEALRSSYPHKDVTMLLGRLDHALIDPSKDDSCEGVAQGAHRLNRGVRFARAVDDQYGSGNHKTRVVIVPGVGHSAAAIFTSPEGRGVLLGTDAGPAGSGAD